MSNFSTFPPILLLLLLLQKNYRQTLAIKIIRKSQNGIQTFRTDTKDTSVDATEESIGIASYRESYDNTVPQQLLIHDNPEEFDFKRFQSPKSIKNALRLVQDSSNKGHYFRGKDGRHGYVSSRKLAGDWVIARSEQLAVKTTAREVLKAYLTGDLQEKWNKKEVLKCNIECRDTIENSQCRSKRWGGNLQLKNMRKDNNMSKRRVMNTGKYYQQDLILKSQRIITSHTGIMRYSQTIKIDQIGEDDFCVIIRLDDSSSASTTKRKPFESLLVHVGLEQCGENVKIYADGIMKVNRKVVPNLIVFDASGIAGSMAGKGTLWLAAHFEEMNRQGSK